MDRISEAFRDAVNPDSAAVRTCRTAEHRRIPATLRDAACGLARATLRSLRAGCLGVALLGGGLAGTAQAAIISGTFSFSASGFGSNPGFGGAGGLAGSFTFSFDNAADIVDSTAITVDSLTLDGVPTALFGSIAFSYAKIGDRLNIGGLAGGAAGVPVAPGVFDFSLRFQPVSDPNGPVFFGLIVGTGNGTTDSGASIRNLSGSFTPAANAVPVPSTLALFGMGFAALCLTRRRRATPGR